MSSFWSNTRVVVTGGAGFLGSFVVEQLRAKGCREIFVPRSKDYDLVQMDAVMNWQESAQDRRMGGQGQGNGSEGVLEEQPPLGQRVQVRRARVLRPVSADVVGAQGVDRDQEDAGAPDLRAGRPRPVSGGKRDQAHRRRLLERRLHDSTNV